MGLIVPKTYTVLRWSDPHDAIAKALVAAQRKMGDVRKSRTATVESNRGGYKYSYADLAAVCEAVGDAYHEAGIAVMQTAAVDYDGETTIANVETCLMHESGQWVRGALAMKPNGSSPQAVGSALTYGRRYGLLGIAGIAPEDDDDGKAASTAAQAPAGDPAPRRTPPAKPKKIGKDRVRKYHETVGGKLVPEEEAELIERVTSGLRRGKGVRRIEDIFEHERPDVWIAIRDRIAATEQTIAMNTEPGKGTAT